MSCPCPRCAMNADGRFDNVSGVFPVERMKVKITDKTSTDKNIKEEVSAKRIRKILIVDDHSMNRRMLELMLKKLGHLCDLAINGVEALDMAVKKQYDLILMDIQMPEMDGLNASKRILEHYEQGAVSIIAVSALVDPDITKECFCCGMKAFYAKPIDRSDLEEIIENF